MGTDEVRIAAWKHGLSTVAKPFDYLLTPPTPGLPHLRPAMKEISADRALDVVAKTFSLVVMYGYCEQRRLYDWDLIRGYD